ncbi:MAG: integration host factor subunit beta [Arenicella sp.]
MTVATYTKSEIIDLLFEKQPYLAHRDAELVVKYIMDDMIEALIAGERIEIRGFGSFSLHHRGSRIGHNPKTGEAVKVNDKFVPHFKAGKDLREKVNATAGN